MQTLTIAGRVGNPKEPRQVGNDTVLNFSIAVDNGKDKDPTWFDCEIWGKRATSLAPHITKGLYLTVNGRPKVRVHDGKAYLGVSINELSFGPRPDGGSREDSGEGYGNGGYGSGGYAGGSTGGAGGFDDGDAIPFAACVLL